MSELEEVVWEGENRTIPNYGEAVNGEKISVPPGMAESFRKQGLVKAKKSAKSTKTREEAE